MKQSRAKLFSYIFCCITALSSGSALVGSYQELLDTRSDRIEKQVAQEVNKQINKVRKEMVLLRQKMNEQRKQQPAIFINAQNRSGAAPWLFNSFNAWKDYLKETPEVDYLPERQKEQFSATLGFAWSDRGYGITGHKEDLAGVVFGKETCALRDVFGMANLLLREEVNSMTNTDSTAPDPTSIAIKNSDHYLYILANQNISLNAHRNEQRLCLSYEKLFHDDRFFFSYTLPLVRVEHTLSLVDADITSSNRQKLQGKNPAFYTTYNNMTDFLQQVLERYNNKFVAKQEEWGVGDLQIAAHYNCDVPYIDSFKAGLYCTLPTGKVDRGMTVWQPELGNSGAAYVGATTSFSWHRGQYKNPFITAMIGYHLPCYATMRVPFLFKYSGDAEHEVLATQLPPQSLLADTFRFKATAFSAQEETLIRHFSSQASVVTLSPGCDIALSLGNTAERCFDRPLSVKCQYDFYAKARSHIAVPGVKFRGVDGFATAVITDDSYIVKHALSAHGSYRFANNTVLSIRGGYVIGGRNTPATYSLACGVATHW